VFGGRTGVKTGFAASDAVLFDYTTHPSYDVNGNATSITRLSGTSNAVTTNIAYDSLLSNPITITDPLGNTTSINYDTSGNATTVIDPLGHQTNLGYNGMGLVTSLPTLSSTRPSSRTTLQI
jgi:YD repeat-containing protein